MRSIAAGTTVTYAEPGSNPLDLFERLQREDGWHRSTWISKAIVQGNNKKLHVAVRYARLRRDDSLIGDYAPSTSSHAATVAGAYWRDRASGREAIRRAPSFDDTLAN